MHLPEYPSEAGTPVAVQRVSGSFFRTLGVDLVLGPGFGDRDARAGEPGLAVVSHTLWRREFGMADDIIGRSIVVDDQLVTIVGVAPRAFRGPDASRRPDLWQVWPDLPSTARMMARLRPGAGVDEASAVAQVVSAQVMGKPGTAFRLGGLPAGREEVRVRGLDWRAAPPPSSCRAPSPHRVACLSAAGAFLSLASVYRHLRILPARCHST